MVSRTQILLPCIRYGVYFNFVIVVMLAIGLMFAVQSVNAIDSDLKEIIVKVKKVRNYAYLTGDRLRLTYQIQVNNDYKLDPASVPENGKVNYWLDLVSKNLTSNPKDAGTFYTLSLTYQIFYAPLDVHKLAIPGMKLNFISNGSILTREMPDWKFLMSPIKEVTQRGVGQTSTSINSFMQKEYRPLLIELKEKEKYIISLLAALLVTLTLIVLIKGNVFAYKRSAFSSALYSIKRNSFSNSEDIQDALKEIHKAFNSLAGRTLLKSDLAVFFDKHTSFSSSAGEIITFFERSSSFFYEGRNIEIDKKSLVSFCKLMANLESVV